MTKEVEHLKELWLEKQRSLERALELQAKEYERRLDDLNNAHERALEVAAATVTRVQFDLQVGELNRRLGELREQFIIDVSKRTGSSAIISGVVAVLISLISAWVLRL